MRRLATSVSLALFGLGVGLVVGAIFVRRVDRAAAQLAPDALGARAGQAAAETVSRFREAWMEARHAAAEREADLRREYGIRTVEGGTQDDLA